MPHQSRTLPDPFEFARRNEVLEGELDARDLPRLAASLRETGTLQRIRYVVSGERIDDKSFLDIRAVADLSLECQRCLTDVRCEVVGESRLLLVPRGQPLPDDELEEDDFDPVHAGRDFDLVEAIEEEVLLALPLAPTHDDCSLPAARENGDDRSPFAVLRGLKVPGNAKSND